jgi:hypothetical protein
MTDSGSTKPTGLQRGQLRRRLRHQQRIREALLLDLGALVFELHRQGRREPELLQAKAAEVAAVDGEVRALAEALEADATLEMLSPGVAGPCANCGALLSTGDRYCSSCGTASGGARREIGAGANGRGERDLERGRQQALNPGRPPWARDSEPEPITENLITPVSRKRKRIFGRRGSGR